MRRKLLKHIETVPPGRSQRKASEDAQVSKQLRKLIWRQIRHHQGTADRKRGACTAASSNSSSLHPTFLGSWLGLNCVIYYLAIKCSLINILFIVVFLWCGSYNKIIFSADKIVSSLYNFMLELNVWIIHDNVKGIMISKYLVT